jgi:hypothetical protein
VSQPRLEPNPGYGATGATSVTGAASQDISDSTVGEMFGHVAQDLSLLMRQELELAKAEVKQEVSKTGKAAGMLGGAGFAGYMVLLFASIAAWWGLANVMDQGWAALIVTAIWAVIGAVLFIVGRDRMKQVNPKPEQTVETVKELPDTLKPAARSRA